jgi:hypothetical protein
MANHSYPVDARRAVKWNIAMPEEHPSDDAEEFLLDQKSFEDRKQGLIDDLLRERAAGIKAFDDKLARLGYH